VLIVFTRLISAVLNEHQLPPLLPNIAQGRRGRLTVPLGGARLDVVDIDIEFRIWVGRTCGHERHADVVNANDVVEHALAVGAVIVKHLVHYVPGVDFALEVGHHLRDVVRHHGSLGGKASVKDRGSRANITNKGALVGDGANPIRELGVPDEGVRTDLHPVLLRERDKLVGITVRELASAR
jgi:hypothetical protein